VIPLFVTSLLIPVVLVFSGAANPVDATAPLFNPIIILFLTGFLMAEEMQRCSLDHRIAVSITARSGRNAATLFGAMLVLTAVLSMFMPNTAAAALLVPIASSVDFALVVGTPPTMIAYSTRLYTAGQIFRRGIVLDLVGIVLLVFVVTRIWELFGLV